MLDFSSFPSITGLKITTVYEFLGGRFGDRTRRAAAMAFIGGRLLASGVRLFIAALAFSAATSTDLRGAIIVCGVIAGLYTLVGGIRAVIWTDTLQAGVFLLGAGVLLFCTHYRRTRRIAGNSFLGRRC